MDHVLYAPTEGELSLVAPKSLEALILCEIWSELPPYEFSPTPSSSGKTAMKAMGENFYIWVPPTTAEVLAATKDLNKKPLLRAHGRRSGGFINILVVEVLPAETDQAACIEDAEKFNRKQLARARRFSK